jgi:hypothetical protein
MPGDEDRSPLLHFTDAAGKMSLGFNDRKVSGHVYPPAQGFSNMVILTILVRSLVVKK